MALTRLLSESNRRIGILDGGLATHLETALGQDLTSSLWSAALLQDDTPRADGTLSGVQAIMRAHIDFLEAGADIIESCNYQAAEETFAKLGHSPSKARQLMLRSIDLAVQAREHFLASDAGRARLAAGGSRPLIALSLGPYGAMLGNGAEYTGEYPSPDDAEVPISQEDLEAFHQRRLECFVGTPQWEHIDLIAFETIPRVDEITAVRGAMLEVARTARWAPETPRKDVLVSVVFPNGQNLPHPHIDAHPTSKDMDGDEIRDNECTEIMREAFKPCYDVDSGITEDEHVDWPVTAVGINCTKPHFIRELVCAMSNAMADARYDPAPHLFLYPDGGQVWDGEARAWRAAPGSTADTSTPEKWATELRNCAADALAIKRWAGVWLGGCCKAGDVEIRKLKEATTPGTPAWRAL